MNAHALAALTTGENDEQTTLDEWIAHTVAVTLAWEALQAAVRDEIEAD